MNKKLIIILILVSVASYVIFVETNNYFNGSLHDMPRNIEYHDKKYFEVVLNLV